MKNCLRCGAKAHDKAECCGECGVSFAEAARTEAIGRNAATAVDALKPNLDQNRPNGMGVLTLGIISIFVGVACVLLSFAASEVEASWYWLVVGGSLAELGLVLWAVGYVVRAIFFLPGKAR